MVFAGGSDFLALGIWWEMLFWSLNEVTCFRQGWPRDSEGSGSHEVPLSLCLLPVLGLSQPRAGGKPRGLSYPEQQAPESRTSSCLPWASL